MANSLETKHYKRRATMPSAKPKSFVPDDFGSASSCFDRYDMTDRLSSPGTKQSF
jgi:hypothetical protein